MASYEDMVAGPSRKSHGPDKGLGLQDKDDPRIRKSDRSASRDTRSGGRPERSIGSRPSTKRPNPLEGMNADQCKEHVMTCVRLAQQNKIDLKNAFNLHIIDIMEELIKVPGDVNFKIATSALDAGTKVYVGRVDYVHNEAVKVANAIIHALDNKGKKKGNDEEEAQDQDDPMDGGEGDDNGVRKQKERKRRPKGRTIAANPESLNISKEEARIEIDPIFHKLTTSHDMGNIQSSFVVQLKTDKNGQFILDSHEKSDFRQEGDSISQPQNVNLGKELTKTVRDLSVSKNKIFDDPFFTGFSFKRTGADVDYARFLESEEASTYKFDPNAESRYDDDVGGAPIDVNLSRDELIEDMSDDENDPHNAQTDLEKSIMQAVNLESLSDLKKLLSEGDEYSYFKNLAVVGAQFGPSHWKPNVWLRMQKARQTRLAAIAEGQIEGPVMVASKAKKVHPIIDFEAIAIPEMKSGKGSHGVSSKMKVATLEKWQKGAETLSLPPHQYFNRSELLRPTYKENCRFKIWSKKSSRKESETLSCPPSPAMDDDMDADDPLPDFEPLGTQPLFTSDFQSQTIVASQGGGGTLTGDNLIEAPEAITQIILPYAKRAKRMDVKKVKNVMMDFIKSTSSNTSFSENPATQTESVCFKDVYKELKAPGKLPTQMSTDMSPAIAFVTLLHLANEHNLELKNLDGSNPDVDITSPQHLSACTDIIIRKETQAM